jgi:hypothetical protein
MSTVEQQISSSDQDDQLAAIRRMSNIRSYGVIKGIMGSGVIDSLPLRVRCECGVPICEEIIEVNLANRREIRRNYPRGFIVVPSHANSLQDITLHETKLLSVVEKVKFSEDVIDL